MCNKAKIEGFWNETPIIKCVSFDMKGKIKVVLQDGRIIIVPISKFPNIKKLSMSERKKWFLFGNGFTFENCDEVFHIEQFLGNFNNYKHENN